MQSLTKRIPVSELQPGQLFVPENSITVYKYLELGVGEMTESERHIVLRLDDTVLVMNPPQPGDY